MSSSARKIGGWHERYLMKKDLTHAQRADAEGTKTRRPPEARDTTTGAGTAETNVISEPAACQKLLLGMRFLRIPPSYGGGITAWV